jgi:diguanylate cyclase (GGDEF)-like protein
MSLSLTSRRLEILLVEDNPGDVRLVAEVLKQAKVVHHLTVACNAVEALAFLHRTGQHEFALGADLILMDINLPGMNGLDLIQKIKTDPKLVRIPIVALTSSDADDDVRRAYDAYANCYVRKPLDLDQFVAIMRNVSHFWLSVVSLPEGVRELSPEVLHVLLVEDNPGDVGLVREQLSQCMNPRIELHVVASLRAAFDELRKRLTYSCVLLDLNLPDSKGLESAESMLRSAPMMPLVVLSAEHDEHMALRAIQLGAQDYVFKGSGGAAQIQRAIRYAIERKQVQGRLDFLATHDALTGLPNRQLFIDSLNQLITYSKRDAGDAAVVVVGLTGLGLINQGYGHDTGDTVIRAAVARLQQCLPEATHLSYTGGVEFAFTLSDRADVAEAPDLGERIIEAIRRPFRMGDQEFYLNCSVGMALHALDADQAHALLKCAESALYQARNLGSNGLRFYSADMNTHLRERLEFERELRYALERNQFELHFQPIIDAQSGRMVGAEALVRWRHPERGLIYPEKFLPTAEQTDLMVDLGAWVLSTACREASGWQTYGAAPRVAVNVSARQFERDDFVKRVAETLAATGIPPGQLELELTESVMQRGQSRAAVAALRRMGVGISIDDFGTGFSSLSYLKAFPVDTLKIDRSFVANVTSDTRDAAIVRAIVAMAHNLDIGVVAEGVETAAQFEFLRQHGCDQVQGYYFGRPTNAAAMLERLQNRAPIGAGKVL